MKTTKRRLKSRPGSQRIGELQSRQQQDECRDALQALLMQPLMPPSHAAFAAVRRQADTLREWFLREAGWLLQIERGGARLYKRPADLLDASRGLPGYDRRRYVLLCLACAVLERADSQITLQLLGERVMVLAAEPELAARGFAFTLRPVTERRELVGVCRSLMGLGVLLRVAGDEEGFVADPHGSHGDALYDVQRRLLAGMLAAVRGPSTWSAGTAPVDFEARLQSLVDDSFADSDEARRTALRHRLARRLLDDPVVYTAALDAETRAYFINQRGPMAARLCAATGLSAEQRAEGLALTDESGALTDVAMPAEGTEAHATLLVAEHLAGQLRQFGAGTPVTLDALRAFLREAAGRYGKYWRKSAREPGAEAELAQAALERLQQLQLVSTDGEQVLPLPAIARYALGAARTQDLTPHPRQDRLI